MLKCHLGATKAFYGCPRSVFEVQAHYRYWRLVSVSTWAYVIWYDMVHLCSGSRFPWIQRGDSQNEKVSQLSILNIFHCSSYSWAFSTPPGDNQATKPNNQTQQSWLLPSNHPTTTQLIPIQQPISSYTSKPYPNPIMKRCKTFENSQNPLLFLIKLSTLNTIYIRQRVYRMTWSVHSLSPDGITLHQNISSKQRKGLTVEHSQHIQSIKLRNLNAVSRS